MSERILEKLGQKVSLGFGETPDETRLLEQRRAFLSVLDHPTPRYRLGAFTLAGIAAALGVVLLALHLFGQGEIPFWVGPRMQPGVEGHWAEANNTSEVNILFEGGSNFNLKKGSSARVIAARSEQVVVDLASGRMDCSVSGNGRTHWIIRAGTYHVTVTGTRFSVTWAPSTDNLEVQVEKGSVLVSGTRLNTNGVKLGRGDRLEVAGHTTTVSRNETSVDDDPPVSEIDKADRPDDKADDSHGQTDKPIIFRNMRGRKGVNENTKSKDSSLWKNLYSQKNYAGALEAAEVEGLEKLVNTLNEKDLWQLGKAARYTQKGVAARKILMAIRSRFRGTERAQNATFLLGRVSEELLGDRASAQKWYQLYLANGPSGSLAEESLGRLIDLSKRAGDMQQAQTHARSYLAKYPRGSFADLAHSVLK